MSMLEYLQKDREIREYIGLEESLKRLAKESKDSDE